MISMKGYLVIEVLEIQKGRVVLEVSIRNTEGKKLFVWDQKSFQKGQTLSVDGLQVEIDPNEMEI